ncbi:MAG TPA: glycosyltransferase family 2 protein [Gemmatimonadales bacterium]|nr:glycosyltransferase family 2 protein [Gemmatimonadales bacterium]
MTARPRIIVLTPVRNEAWILDRFLAVTSRFADHIVVADQQSTDDSRVIASRYPKVTLIDNPSSGFNEAERQLLLLDAARKLVSGPRVLLALDADEILAADGLATRDWSRMLEAAPGTVLGLERVDLLAGEAEVMRHGLWTALGYVDDGAAHTPLLIHSTRIPAAEDAPVLVLPGLKVLHYALVRPTAVAAKSRWYSALENVLGTCANPLKRRARYHDMMDFAGTARVEPADPAWFAGWEAAGVRMRGDQDESFYWYDVEVLRLMAQHGERKFWWDDIWDVDWEGLRHELMSGGAAVPGRPIDPRGIPADPITGPPAWLRVLLRTIDPPYRAQRALKNQVTPRHRRERSRRQLPAES